MSSISTHVLDTSIGRPGTGIKVTLENLVDKDWKEIGGGVTNDDGRVPELLNEGVTFDKGTYRISFDLEDYFSQQDRDSFYPEAKIVFIVKKSNEHYHVPLLLSGFGYSTYRGS